LGKYSDYGKVVIGQETFVGQNCVLGCPKEETIKRFWPDEKKLLQAISPVRIGDRSVLCNFVCVYEGTEIGPDCLLEDYVHIGYGSKIGQNVRIMYRSYICDRVTIGNYSRIAGFICDGSEIGEYSTVMGNLVHEYTQPHIDWWKAEESPPKIGSNSVVGLGATVVGGIEIGSHCYIAAGAIVTKSVPPKHVVLGVNRRIPLHKWKGKKLRRLIELWMET